MDDNGMVHVYVLLPRGKRLRAEFIAELADKLVRLYDCGADMEINMRPELDDPVTLANRLYADQQSFIVVCDKDASDYYIIPVADNLGIIQKLQLTDCRSAWRIMTEMSERSV